MSGLSDLSCAYETNCRKYYLDKCDKCFLLRSMKAKRFNLREPLYTKGLAKSKRKRYKLYIQVIR